jgi:hypothetical protein
MSRNEEAFGWYLAQRGFDLTEVHKKYLAAMQSRPRYIMQFYMEEYPAEWQAWKTKQRILGDA